MLKPASVEQIADMLIKLSLQYPSPAMNKEQFKMMIIKYIEDLSPYPIDLIEQACAAYAQNTDNRFFPKSYKLSDLIMGAWRKRKQSYDKMLILFKK